MQMFLSKTSFLKPTGVGKNKGGGGLSHVLGSPGSPGGSREGGHCQRVARLAPTLRLPWAQIYYVRFGGKKNKSLKTAASEPNDNNGNHAQGAWASQTQFLGNF